MQCRLVLDWLENHNSGARLGVVKQATGERPLFYDHHHDQTTVYSTCIDHYAQIKASLYLGQPIWPAYGWGTYTHVCHTIPSRRSYRPNGRCRWL